MEDLKVVSVVIISKEKSVSSSLEFQNCDDHHMIHLLSPVFCKFLLLYSRQILHDIETFAGMQCSWTILRSFV